MSKRTDVWNAGGPAARRFSAFSGVIAVFGVWPGCCDRPRQTLTRTESSHAPTDPGPDRRCLSSSRSWGRCILGFGARADQPPKPEDVTALMHKKLVHAQKILEGIALADLDLVGQNAADLAVLSKQVQFKVLKTPQYELHANEFRRALGGRPEGRQAKEPGCGHARLPGPDDELRPLSQARPRSADRAGGLG